MTSEERAKLRDLADREAWAVQQAWRNRPHAERKRLLATCDDVEVVYDGAGYDAHAAPEGGFRARARVISRDARTLEVMLVEPLRVMADRGMILYGTVNPLRFTTGGMHKDAPHTTIICVPVGWRPAPYPTRAAEDGTGADDSAKQR